MAGPGICIVLDGRASEVHPVFNPITPYEYLFPSMYLFIADIAYPDSFVCGCRTWICLDITLLHGEQRQLPAGRGRHAKINGKSGPINAGCHLSHTSRP